MTRTCISLVLACVALAPSYGCDTEISSANGNVKQSDSDDATDRPLFAGTALHDFGEIQIDDRVRENLRNVFELTNCSGSKLKISNVSRSCGCVSVEYPPEVILPGEKVRVVVTMQVPQTGLRTETVRLLLSNGRTQTLQVSAYGISETQYFISYGALKLKTHPVVEVTVIAVTRASTPPEQPQITSTTDAVHWETGNWESDAVSSRVSEDMINRWTMNLKFLKVADEPFLDEQFVTVSFRGERKRFTLSIDQLPFAFP